MSGLKNTAAATRDDATPADTHRLTRTVLRAVVAWFIAAFAIGVSGVIESLRPPGPQVVLLAVTAACLGVLLGRADLRAWALAVDERLFVAFHLTRFVGIYFLVLHGRGLLSYGFAVVGGWGDIVVAVGAVALLGIGHPTPGWKRLAYDAWNLYGLVDILFVIGSAARSALADPASMRPLVEMPLNLLLTFVVPIILATHLLLGSRFVRRQGRLAPR